MDFHIKVEGLTNRPTQDLPCVASEIWACVSLCSFFPSFYEYALSFRTVLLLHGIPCTAVGRYALITRLEELGELEVQWFHLHGCKAKHLEFVA